MDETPFALRARPRRRVDELLPSELYVLRWYSHGLTAEMVADVMGISPYTVRQYRDRARLKLAAKNTAHAVAIAFRHGLLD